MDKCDAPCISRVPELAFVMMRLLPPSLRELSVSVPLPGKLVIVWPDVVGVPVPTLLMSGLPVPAETYNCPPIMSIARVFVVVVLICVVIPLGLPNCSVHCHRQ